MVSALRWSNFGLRGVLFCFITISLGLTAHLRSDGGSFSRINLGIAASTITMVFSVFFPWVWLFLDSVYNIIPLLVLDFISFALVLSDSAALTNDRGSYCDSLGHCSEIRAAEAFLYMSWIILLFAFCLELYELIAKGQNGGSSSSGFGSGIYPRGGGVGAAGLGGSNVPAPAPEPEPKQEV